MDISISILLKIFVGLVLIFGGLSLVGVAWKVRLKIVGAMATGLILFGLPCLPLVRPAGPYWEITIAGGSISVLDILIMLAAAYLTGFCAYFICGAGQRDAAVLAVPGGMALWGLSRGDMSSLLRINSSLQQRGELYSKMRFEGLMWLCVLAAGYFGAVSAELFWRRKRDSGGALIKRGDFEKVIPSAAAILGAGVVGYFAIGIFVQDVRIFDSQLGSVVGQPSAAQIAFGVFVSFAIAAFIVRYFMGVNYVWPVIATAVLSYFAIRISAGPEVLRHMVENWPVVFYPRAVCAILPVQMVSFGAIGSIAGCWSAVKYRQWRLEQV